MSTAKKKTIKFTAFITLLILSITYFSLLSPTSAYFYKTETLDADITFASFDVKQDRVIFDNESELKFKGATKFADFNELLFDDVAIIKEVTLTNEGDAPARILTRVTPDDESVEKGFKYIVFSEKNQTTVPEETTTSDGTATVADETTTAVETTTSAKVQKGSMKDKIEKTLGLTADTNKETAVNLLNAYNEVQSKNDDIVLKKGESAKVTFVFWAEYDEVVGKVTGGLDTWQNAADVEKISYNCHVEIIASQDEDKAVSSIFETTTVEETTVAG